MKKSNLLNREYQPFINNCKFIHIDSWENNDSYVSMIFSRVDGKSDSQVLVYDVFVKKLIYEDKKEKLEIVNIYQNLESLIKYLIAICSNEGDWILDLFFG